MNLHRYDHLLEQVNDRSTLEQRLRKMQEEMSELDLATHHFLDDRDTQEHLEEELADVFLTAYCTVLKLSPDAKERVQMWLEEKARRLHAIVIDGVKNSYIG